VKLIFALAFVPFRSPAQTDSFVHAMLGMWKGFPHLLFIYPYPSLDSLIISTPCGIFAYLFDTGNDLTACGLTKEWMVRTSNKQSNSALLFYFRWFDFMGIGDFLLYRNTERNFEVRNICTITMDLTIIRRKHVGCDTRNRQGRV